MKILILGADGQLGTDLVKTNPGRDVVGAVLADADVTDAGAVRTLVEKHRPAWVVNTTAFTRTEDCEEKPELAFAVNAFGARNAATAARGVGARLLTIGTDFVFDGEKGAPYVESDPVRPLNVYGISKYAGERLAQVEAPDAVVARGASLFGAAGALGKGGNFVESILKKAKAGEDVSVVNDIVVSPTYTRDMAARLWELIDRNAPGGVYHIVNPGACSWWEFAAEALRLVGLPAPKPVPSSAYPSKIKRPKYAALGSERLKPLGFAPLRSWRDALKAYLVEKGHIVR